MTLRQDGAAGRLFFQKKLLSYETDRIGVHKFVSSVKQSRRGGWLKVGFYAVGGSPAGSKYSLLVLCASPRVRDTTRAPQRRSRPKRHLYKEEREVRLSCRIRSRSSVRLEPFEQYSYPRASLELLWWGPPRARESWCLRVVCLHGEMWLPSVLLQACYTLICPHLLVFFWLF